MIIDIHGHSATAPETWRNRQVAAIDGNGARLDPAELRISDDELREHLLRKICFDTCVVGKLDAALTAAGR